MFLQLPEHEFFLSPHRRLKVFDTQTTKMKETLIFFPVIGRLL